MTSGGTIRLFSYGDLIVQYVGINAFQVRLVDQEPPRQDDTASDYLQER